jgi:2-methylisocitrate lyase-like PEP mutase family enzyme
MSTQQDRARAFQALHVKGAPLVLFNIWDVGSAKAVEKAGAKALATGSRSVAGALGYDDGESLPMAVALEQVSRIVRSTDLPVSIDFEGGYARDPQALAANVELALNTGIIGFNFEDQIVGGEGLYSITQQSARIAAVRQTCEKAGVQAFINARTDVFLKAPRDQHNEELVEHALERAKAYQEAGASGFFIPGLLTPSHIANICSTSTLPVNVMTMAGAPTNLQLAQQGVARISYGPGPWRDAMAHVEESARAALR